MKSLEDENEARREIVAHAVRWGSNMIVEAIGNHGKVLTKEQRECLEEATAALAMYETL